MALAFVMYTPVLILYKPPHRCVLPENETMWIRPTSLEDQSCYLEHRSTPVCKQNIIIQSVRHHNWVMLFSAPAWWEAPGQDLLSLWMGVQHHRTLWDSSDGCTGTWTPGAVTLYRKCTIFCRWTGSVRNHGRVPSPNQSSLLAQP